VQLRGFAVTGRARSSELMLQMAAIAKESAPARRDAALAALAIRQYGVIARRQLRQLGLSDGAIAHRVAAGRLHRLHHGVYAVGHTVIGPRARWMAAVLSCGTGAVLSHAAAGALWELRASEATIVDVTVPGSGGRPRRPGVRLHRARSLDGQTAIKDGIPVTTPARTILDLAAKLDGRPLERLLDQAENARLTDVPSLDALARAHATHKGARKLRATLQDHEPGTTLTKSELEERFLKLCRRAGLPKPKVNDDVEGLEVDFVFKDDRVLVETDSWRHHKSREAFENDRRRDAIHAAAGYRTLRFTHRQITHDPTTVERALSAALTRPDSPDTPARSAA
jgi:very-short-patch-repair endonuclease/predicted transcriptional regulator of viral defense system